MLVLPTSTVSSIRPRGSRRSSRGRGPGRSGSARRRRGSRRRSRRPSRATSRVSPPEASVQHAGGRQSDATARRSSSDMLSSRTRSAPASTASRTCSTVSHSTSTGEARERARTGREGGCATPPAASDVVVLDQRGVGQRHAVVHAAAAAHGVLLQRAQARASSCGCRGLGAGARDGVDPARGQRRDARQVAEQVERGALGGQQRARRPGRPQQWVAGGRPGRRRGDAVDERRRPPRSNDQRRDPSAGDDPAGAGTNAAVPCRSAGTVATLVTSTPPARSSSRSAARARSTGSTARGRARVAAGAGGRLVGGGRGSVARSAWSPGGRARPPASGWSSRQWQPRVSRRSAAPRHERRRDRDAASVASQAPDAGRSRADRRARRATSARLAGWRRSAAPRPRRSSPGQRGSAASTAARCVVGRHGLARRRQPRRGRRRSAPRRPGPPAGCWRRAGWRRGRRCRRPRRRRTGRDGDVRPARVGVGTTPPLA